MEQGLQWYTNIDIKCEIYSIWGRNKIQKTDEIVVHVSRSIFITNSNNIPLLL